MKVKVDQYVCAWCVRMERTMTDFNDDRRRFFYLRIFIEFPHMIMMRVEQRKPDVSCCRNSLLFGQAFSSPLFGQAFSRGIFPLKKVYHEYLVN